jgi:phosphohistidine phosphatase
MGRLMAEEGLIPELVLCSTAVRTRETWSLIEPLFGDGIRVVYDENLYGASAGTLLRIVQAVPDNSRRVLLIGHNPGIETFADGLVGSGSDEALEKLRRKYPTAALAQLSSDTDHWADIAPGGCRLERFVRPKDLPGADAWNHQ